jgi:hypothetical protein
MRQGSGYWLASSLLTVRDCRERRVVRSEAAAWSCLWFVGEGQEMPVKVRWRRVSGRAGLAGRGWLRRERDVSLRAEMPECNMATVDSFC